MSGVLARAALVVVAALTLAGCGGDSTGRRAAPVPTPTLTSSARSAPTSTAHPRSSGPHARGSLPQPDHVVIAVLENHSFTEIVGHAEAPFLESLAGSGAVLTQSYAVAHPSEPNYLALFSGSTQHVTDDACPLTFSGANLARALLDAGFTFAGYSEDLPSVGYTGCQAGGYARKHNPWVDFDNVPASVNRPMTDFPSDFATLPTVSFVIPNLAHDMHDGTLAQADQWLHQHLGNYAAWARTHHSLLIITADEDDSTAGNRIATIISGAFVAPGRYGQRVDHYGMLRTIEDAYGLAALGASAQAKPIKAIWRH